MGSIPNLIDSLVNQVEVWIDENFVKRNFIDQFDLVQDIKMREKMISQRVARRVSFCRESVQVIDKVDPRTGHSLLLEIIATGDFELLKRLVGKGVNLSMRYPYRIDGQERLLPGMTVLHHAAMRTSGDVMKLLVDSSPFCPSCDRNSALQTPVHFAYSRLPMLKTLIHDCHIDVASLDVSDWTPLHQTAHLATTRQVGSPYATISRPFDCAMLLLEGDYQRAIRGAPWFNVKSTEILLTTRDRLNGMTALEIATHSSKGADRDFIRLLRRWESSSLASPPRGCRSSTASVNFNRRLTPFQRFLAHGVYDLLQDTAIHSVAYQVLGYLSPMDVLSNWNEWRDDIATPKHVKCYCCSLRNK